MPINISNPKNRDAVVALESLTPKREIHYVDEKGKPIVSQRVLKADMEHDLPKLLETYKKPAGLADALVESDPEIDTEKFGMFLHDTSRVYVSNAGIVHLVEEFEVIANPDGTERERRPRKKLLQNMNAAVPLRWTGKFIKKEVAVKKFIFTNKKQLVHINGLTFDFLFEMAKELDKKNSLLLLRGGAAADEPLVMNRGGKPYNAFLEGRVKGKSYCLILHLSNMELKKPVEVENDQS